MFKIGEFAKLNKISVKTLRYYDELGILRPAKIDDETGYRYYSAKQLPRLNKIIALKNLSFSLSEISKILQSDLSVNIVTSMLYKKKQEIMQNIKLEKVRLVKVERLINSIKEDDDLMLKYDVVLKKLERKKVASIRDIIGDYSKQHNLWIELMGYLQSNNAKIVAPSMSVYYDPGHKENDVDIEVMSCIGNDIQETDRIKIKELSEVENAACLIHKGPYEEFNISYNVLLKWIEENGYRIAGPNRELYLEGERSTDNPQEYITEIQIPVEKN
ncbi:MerR family transcriptional regulator [Clostridium brassicae]|uniref:MerR family transcriptional regulator n=1 Tax=Clostridium brassicae TaxID=2999072 RepID=A0ABT4D426_9CLOT|nr:MerR family transcriptional regulator [Clostridium brassicae]MCY6957041.1 MerR family transcriptional regulator [Clostridium brassicae]